MKNLLILCLVSLVSLLTACTPTAPSRTQVAENYIHRRQVLLTSKEFYPPKNPQTIKVFSEANKPSSPYRVIGVATVAKYNLIGFERKQDLAESMLKNLAASIGGDGIINFAIKPEMFQAQVIAYQKIML